VLQCVEVCCNVFRPRVALNMKDVLRESHAEWHDVSCVVQYIAACCSELQCVAVCCSVLQCVAVCCSV